EEILRHGRPERSQTGRTLRQIVQPHRCPQSRIHYYQSTKGLGMHRLRLARQGYEQLAAELASSPDERVSDRAEAWLRDEVCPVVEEVLQNPSFRLAARWSMDHLTPGVNTSERRFVEDLDARLLRYAAAPAAGPSPPAAALPTYT